MIFIYLLMKYKIKDDFLRKSQFNLIIAIIVRAFFCIIAGPVDQYIDGYHTKEDREYEQFLIDLTRVLSI